MADHKVTFMQNEYTNDTTGEKAPGVTVILNGKFGEVISQLLEANPNFTSNIQVIQEALFRGLNSMLKEKNIGADPDAPEDEATETEKA
ncbi:MAG: hypothetical protein IKX57_02595 [Oscillospiraceae bacterium]|nr:hypothetical protein [Oscillospiraceae bacterium]